MERGAPGGALPRRARGVTELARPERFELPTPWFVARYSIQLSYGRAGKLDYRGFPVRGRARYDRPPTIVPRHRRVAGPAASFAPTRTTRTLCSPVDVPSAAFPARSRHAVPEPRVPWRIPGLRRPYLSQLRRGGAGLDPRARGDQRLARRPRRPGQHGLRAVVGARRGGPGADRAMPAGSGRTTALPSQISTTIPSWAHSSGTSSAWASISRLMWVRMMRFAPKSALCATTSG